MTIKLNCPHEVLIATDDSGKHIAICVKEKYFKRWYVLEASRAKISFKALRLLADDAKWVNLKLRRQT